MSGRSHRLFTLLVPALAATFVAGCQNDLSTGPRVATLVVVSGMGQQNVVGATVSQALIVRAQDQAGRPIEGLTVVWAVQVGGGTVTPSQSLTDEEGRASAIFRLGSLVGTQRVSATITGITPVTFTANATAAPPSQVSPTAGNGQTGAVGSPLGQALQVKVTDAFGNAKSGVTVTFAVTSGGGSLSAPTAITDANGVGSVQWTLGPVAGTQTVSATVTGVPPISFQAIGTAGVAKALSLLAGNAQTTAPGTPFPDSLVARVVDQFGNGVGGVTVTWTAGARSGSVSPTSTVSDNNGRVAVSWTLGATGGPNTVSAVITGVSGNVVFTGTGLVSYVSINAGERHTCGLSSQDVNYCWGYNGDGQLGIGLPPQGSGPVFAFPQPVAAIGSLTFRQAVGSRFHTCALTLSGIGYCWGTNLDGRLGNNTVIPSTTPVQLVTSTTFKTINPGRLHTCGLSLTNRAFCWGYARDGALGIGFVPVDSILLATEVAGARNYKSVATGRSHSCAVTTGGVVWCWGDNQLGQLGDGTVTGSFLPVLTATAMGIDSVTAGGNHSCALTTAGAALCWGDNTFGQLGRGNTTASLTPVAVSGGLVFVQVSAGFDHTCGLSITGIAYCWGDNSSGQLGTGNRVASNAPTPVGGGLAFRMINAGALGTCGISTAGVAYCWGDNKYGQIGDNTETDRLLPTRVAFQP